MGEPPELSMTVSLTTRPAGMKKLVPPSRSSNSRIPAASSTGKESRARMAVVNQVQTVSGIFISDIPLVRILRTVVMKLRAPSREAIQKRAMLMIQRS